MAMREPSRRSSTDVRVLLGAVLLIASAGLTYLRARATAEPIANLSVVVRMHGEGRASDAALANAQYHGAHAQADFDDRWRLTGYAAQGMIGGLLGLALVLPRRRRQ